MKTEIKYGVICGAVIVSYSLLTFYLIGDISKLNPSQFASFESLGYLRYLVLIFTLYLALRERKKNPSYTISFGSLMKTGVMVTLIVSVMIGLMHMVYLYLNPDFIEKYSQLYLNQMKAAGKSAEEMNMAKTAMESQNAMKTPWVNGLFYFFLTAFIGNIAVLAFSMIMRPRQQ